MKSFTTLLLFFLTASVACADPDFNNLAIQYDAGNKFTVVSANEKLIDATTSLGAAYNFPGRVIHQSPKAIDVSLYGYHDTVQWQSIETLTVTYDGKTYSHKVFHSLHGEDRDKNADLAQGKYLESVLIQLPLDIASQVFNGAIVTIISSPAAIDVNLSAEQMKPCHDLLDTVPTEASLSSQNIKGLDMKSLATSMNGLPVTREITESSGDVTLTIPLTALTPRFGLRTMAFITSSGRKLRQPTEALCIAELSDTPLLDTEKEITLNYGDTHLILASNFNNSRVLATGAKFTVRTYPITYSRFLVVSKAKNLSFTVGDTTVSIPSEKMTGIREIARRIQQH